MCCRLPASGLLRPEARWPDKVLFSAEKSGALRANAASRLRPAGRGWNGFDASGGVASRQMMLGGGRFWGMVGDSFIDSDFQGE